MSPDVMFGAILGLQVATVASVLGLGRWLIAVERRLGQLDTRVDRLETRLERLEMKLDGHIAQYDHHSEVHNEPGR